ncbi:proline oxidase PrnD [Histoplasma capsulatum var. duboisii H88]|uniref:Proline dehydrogenase n=1 Tax=Ajellomyces capsulatus (strain H88) TaxID=544711 RepID=F0UKP0_AJEC8|nr:proline oxidase PrnD [Histoplasma capsulatum var. duboisii H88]QSS56626.1 proline oxidase PrnD [Histoplasma capsulatum var. duboisii H88]
MRKQLAFKTTTPCFVHAMHQTSVKPPTIWSQHGVRCSHHGAAQQPERSVPATGGPSAAPRSTRPFATLNSSIPFTNPTTAPPLSILPLSTILRSLFITTISSSPLLFTPSLAFLSVVANPESTFLNPDRNPIIKLIMGQTLYAQFCAGETPAEAKVNIQKLKQIGYSGVILGYAREVVMDENETRALAQLTDTEEVAESKAQAIADITAWKKGTLATVDLADDGDFVALKFTGAGKGSVQQLLRRSAPSPALRKAIIEICERAKARNVRLLFDAEQQAVQPAIDDWTLEFQRIYNKGLDQRAVIYGTYQAYLRSTPATLSQHLAIAEAEGFALGVKLVRGAYLGSEPRHLIWDTKQETDNTYDGIAQSLIKQQYGDILKPHNYLPPSGGTRITSAQRKEQKYSQFPKVDLLLASHNRVSVERAKKLRDEQKRTSGANQIEMAYGQLFGMADDISCHLVQAGKCAREQQAEGVMVDVEAPKICKYLVWGTVGECALYLLRRAQENRDAASRTEDTRKAMAKELRRRLVGGS